MSTNNITYYVSVDSQYRDDSKYPLETDFGVKFKPDDIYATYPDQSFFYPEIAQLYNNTGAYNPHGLAPNPSTITGSGLVYPQGEPLQSNQVYPRVTIDKNFDDQPIKMRAGNILQMKEVGDTIYIAAVATGYANDLLNPQRTWSILVNGEPMYTGYVNYESQDNLPQLVVVATVKKLGNNTYTYGNCLAMNTFIDINGTLTFFPNITSLIDMQINTTLNFCYIMFDFRALKFTFQRIPAVEDPNQSIANLPLVFNKDVFNESPSANLTTNMEWSNVMIVGFSSDLAGLYIFNNAPWGYHQFYTVQNYEMMPSSSGYNQMLTDEAGNIYAAVHTSPTTYTRPLESPRGLNVYDDGLINVNRNLPVNPPFWVPLTPLTSGFKRGVTSGLNNSKPLSHIFDDGSTVTLVYLGVESFFPANPAPFLSAYTYDSVNFAPPVVSTGTTYIGATPLNTNFYWINDAAFFSFNSKNYVVNNMIKLYNLANTTGFFIWEVQSNNPNPATLVLQDQINDDVVALDATLTDVAVTPMFNGNPAVVTMVESAGVFTLYLFEFDAAGSTMIAHGSIVLSDPAYMVCVKQSIYALEIVVVLDKSYLQHFRYDAGTNAPVYLSQIYVPGGTYSTTNDGHISHIMAYDIVLSGPSVSTNFVVAFDQQAVWYVIQVGALVSFNKRLNNASTYNLHFSALNPSADYTLDYLLSSNQYSNQATVWNVTSYQSYQVGDNFTQGDNLLVQITVSSLPTFWVGRNSYGLFHGIGSSAYMSVSPFVLANHDAILLLSQHTVEPQEVVEAIEVVDYASFVPFPSYPNYLATLEIPSSDYFSNVQQVYMFTDLGRFTIFDVTKFPFYNQTSYPWPAAMALANNVGELNFTTPTNKYTQVDVFVATPLPQGVPAVCIVANNGNETRYTNSLIYPTVYSLAGSLGFGYKDGRTGRPRVVHYDTSNGGTLTLRYADMDPSNPMSIIEVYTNVDQGTSPSSGVVVQFANNNTILVLDTYWVISPGPPGVGTTSNTLVWYGLDLRYPNGTPFSISVTIVNVLDTWGFMQMAKSTNPLTLETTVYLNISNQNDGFPLTNLTSTMLTLSFPADGSLYSLIFNIQFKRQSFVGIQQYMPLGCSVDGAQTLNNTTHMAVFQQVESAPTINVSYYDTTDVSNFKLLLNYNVDTTFDNLTNEKQVVKIGGFSNKTILVTLNGFGGAAPGDFGTLAMFDVSNPAIGQSSSSSFNLYNGFGVGNAFICKISSDGTPSWGTQLGDYFDVVLDTLDPLKQPSKYPSQFVNVTGIDLDDKKLNLYASVDWTSKLMVSEFEQPTGSQRLVRFLEGSTTTVVQPTSLSNSSVLKLTTSQGYSEYLLPIYDLSDVNSIDIAVTSTGVIVGESVAGLTTIIYDKQLPSRDMYSLKNPVAYQGVIASPLPYSVDLVCYDFDGKLQWVSKIETKTLNSYNYGVGMAKTSDSVYLLGATTSNIIDFKNKDNSTVQNWTNQVTYNVNNGAFVPNQTYSYVAKYSIGGEYLESDILQTDLNGIVTPVSLYVSEEDNVVDLVHWGFIFNNVSQIYTRNKDGTLGSSKPFSYYVNDDFEVGSPAFALSIGTRYKMSTKTTDVNDLEYSYIVAYKDVQNQFLYQPIDLFAPYLTGTDDIDFTNRNIFIPQLQANYLIRSAYYDETKDEFIILLNQKIATNTIDRIMPATVKYPIEQAIIIPDRYDTLFFYIANISSGLTSSFGVVTPLSPTSILYFSTEPVDMSQQYYLVDSKGDGSVFIIPVFGITMVSANLYQLQCATSNFLPGPGGRPTPNAFLTAFNPNALYTLQFYPAALNMVEYYTVALQNLTIPNRNIRESTIAGVRNLSDFPYVWLEIYNANDEDVADAEFVNNTFSNNPNRNNKVIFQIAVTSAGGGSNFSFYGSGQTTRIKFNPGFYNIRIRLLDPNGNTVLFDSTPDSKMKGDEAFTNGVVDSSLMNIVVDLALTKYNSF